MNGVFNQDTYVFSGQYEDNTGYQFQEVYKLNGKACTNWEVHADQCYLGCNAGTPCSGHSCLCGAAMGIWEYLPGATAAGSCGPAGAGSLWSSSTNATDDDYQRSQALSFCFVNDTPLSITKTYTSSGGLAVADLTGDDIFAGAIRKLAPLHNRIQSIYIAFNTWSPLQASPAAFVEPSSCQC